MTTALFREGKNSYTKTPFMVFQNYTYNLYVQYMLAYMLYAILLLSCCRQRPADGSKDECK